MALTTGLGATAVGYFVQGWFKFGGVEFFKIQAAQYMGEQAAWDSKTTIYLGAAAAAEFIADVFLCPLEAVRIRSVSDPEFCSGLLDGFVKMGKQEGIGAFYAGFAPILAKQIPYTCAKFVVQGSVADSIYGGMGKTPQEVSSSTALGISLGSGVIAGVASAIISHPADTLLSKVNKKGAGGDGPMMTRLMNIAKEIGFMKLCTVGLAPRCVMIGTLTAGQFGIFDTVMNALGAEKFHFHVRQKTALLDERISASNGFDSSYMLTLHCSLVSPTRIQAPMSKVKTELTICVFRALHFLIV